MRSTSLGCLALCVLFACSSADAKPASGTVGPYGDGDSQYDASGEFVPEASVPGFDASYPLPDSGPGDSPNDASLASDGGPAPQGTCGLTQRPGETMQTVMVGSTMRTYVSYIPRTLDPAKPVPLVFVHHGFTMQGSDMVSLTNFKAIADREGFAVAFPDGYGATPWNVGSNVDGLGTFVGAPNTQDDFGFLEAMVTQVDSAQCVDRAHIYVAGFSMGGYFAHHAGCKGPKFVRAIAPHSGGTYSGPCDNGVKPVFIVHGGSDTLIFNSNGEAARSYWVMRNGCSSEVDKMDVKGGSCEWHKGCPAGGQVVKCTFPSMDHGWAGAPCPCGWTSLKYAGGDQYADAAELIWAFFKKNY